jgi:hypothetical protein
MKDFNLKTELSKKNSWVTHVYDLTSGYVHLSDRHIFHFIERSSVEPNGLRNFVLSSSSEHVDDKYKVELVNAFKVVTEGILKLLPEFEKLAVKYNPAELEVRYQVHT